MLLVLKKNLTLSTVYIYLVTFLCPNLKMDDELLIEQVSGYPYLYNKSDVRFKNKRAKELAWQTISNIMEFAAEDCAARWNVLRCRYVTIKRQIRENPSESKASCWPHYEAMGFLDPFLLTRKSLVYLKRKSNHDSSESQSSEGGPLSSWNTVSQMKLDVSETDTETKFLPSPPAPMAENSESERTATPTPTSNPASYLTITSQNVPGSTKRRAQETMCQAITSATSDCQEDDSRGLLQWARSLANDMEILTPIEQILFKKKCYDSLSQIIENKYT